MPWKIYSKINFQRSDTEIIAYIDIHYKKESGHPEKDSIGLFCRNVNKSTGIKNEGGSEETRD